MASSSAARRILLDLMPERLQQFRRAAHGRRALRMEPRMIERRAIHETDSQAARRLTDLVAKPARGRRRHPRIARHVARDRVQRGRGVAHRAYQRALLTQAMPGLGVRGPKRGPAARALEPDQSAERSRNPHRSAGVVAMRDRHYARSDRGGRAAARSAGDPRRVPGIAGCAPRAALGRERRAPFGHRALRERYQAGRAKFRRHV